MDKLKTIYEKFKTPCLIFVAVIVFFIFLCSKLFPIIQSIIKNDIEYRQAVTKLANKQRELDAANKDASKAKDISQLKAFYRPIESGYDTEAAIANEFTEILEIARANLVKTRSVGYTYDPSEDVFVQNAATKYHVALLDMEMIATYKQFESFLRELYKHEHFLDIVDIEINPYPKNKSILVVKLKLKLYAQK